MKAASCLGMEVKMDDMPSAVVEHNVNMPGVPNKSPIQMIAGFSFQPKKRTLEEEAGE